LPPDVTDAPNSILGVGNRSWSTLTLSPATGVYFIPRAIFAKAHQLSRECGSCFCDIVTK